MDSSVSWFIVISLSVYSNGQLHRPCDSSCDQKCYELFSKYDANAFLSNGKKSTPRECCHESYCESQGIKCYTEQFRQYLLTTPSAQSQSCQSGTVVSVVNWCYGHIRYECQDPCLALTIDRCLNGGTCIPLGTSYTCKCRPGYEGDVCSIDINECASNPCNNSTSTGCIDGDNTFTCQCRPGYTGQLCNIDIDECSSSPCQHGGTCTDHVNRYSCNCVAGYTGNSCELEINECESNPCHNGATCQDLLNRFKCECPPRIYGVLCDTNICHPTPADVVFVMDSSLSMTQVHFLKQLEFVANFTRSVHVGPRDFQISVVTFASNAHIEFYLDQFKDNTSIIDAVKNITFKPGSTRTDRGLRAVQSVFNGHGTERRVNGTQASRFVYLLTDGMSTERSKTKEAAKELKSIVENIAVIGIGNEVSHEELLYIATSASLVYSVNNFNSLYTVLNRLVHFTCDECEHSTATDVAIFIDATSDTFESLRDAVTYVIDVMHYLSDNKTHVGITSFSSEIRDIVKLGEQFDKNTIKSNLNSFSKATTTTNEPLEHVLEHARIKIFNTTSSRARAKKMLLIFTDGKVTAFDRSRLQIEKLLLEAMGVHMFAISCTDETAGGSDVNLPGLYDLVTDSFNVFITKKGLFGSLDVLQAEFEYDKCELKGE